MGKVEQTNVAVDIQSLAMHTLVTGSTGSGKSIQSINYYMN